jgi:arylsulfatase
MVKAPNILVFFTDQQRADTIGALGNETIQTPVLDRLVREGTTFTRAYTPSPVCVPARCALATGQLPARSECWDNQDMPEVTSYMERLQQAGYQTHGVGKMHFQPDHRKLWGYETRDISEEGKPGDFPDFLKANGFGHALACNGLRGEYYYTPQPSQLPAHLHETHWVADRCIDFLNRRDRDRPFLLDCHFIKPHPPFENPMPWSFLYRPDEMPHPHQPVPAADVLTRVNQLQNRYKYKDRAAGDDLAWRTMKAAYYAAISFIDQQIGRILETLGDDIDNTLILFAADHGEMMGDYGCAGKRCMLEASARIPLIARWPGHFAANAKVDTAVSLIDIFPTLMAAAGIETEPSVDRPGSDLATIATGAEPGRIVFSQFQAKWMGHYMATDGRQKFVHSAADHRSWLFEVEDTLCDTPMPLTENHPLETAALELFGRFPACEAVENGTWKTHDVPPWPDDPDYGLLRQDPDGIEEMLETIRPYYRGNSRSADDGLKTITDHMP